MLIPTSFSTGLSLTSYTALHTKALLTAFSHGMGHSRSLAQSPSPQAQHGFQPALPAIPDGISAGCGLLGLPSHAEASTGCGEKPISQCCCAQSSFPVSSSWSQCQNECKHKGLHPHASPMQYIFGNQDRGPDQIPADYCPTSAAAHEVGEGRSTYHTPSSGTAAAAAGFAPVQAARPYCCALCGVGPLPMQAVQWAHFWKHMGLHVAAWHTACPISSNRGVGPALALDILEPEAQGLLVLLGGTRSDRCQQSDSSLCVKAEPHIAVWDSVKHKAPLLSCNSAETTFNSLFTAGEGQVRLQRGLERRKKEKKEALMSLTKSHSARPEITVSIRSW
ncbi:hypothetical protein CIB84_007519 [Bambusicola thoracicus]|uniref:Uncharacterized protein n=1 Tax=Bambusicola thoracicus TaxID=9083 RepID=A0A2P4SX93_BAMTH|nr:hypothetical protein CIB84_007519 [Bambusicola thoracicus]